MNNRNNIATTLRCDRSEHTIITNPLDCLIVSSTHSPKLNEVITQHVK